MSDAGSSWPLVTDGFNPSVWALLLAALLWVWGSPRSGPPAAPATPAPVEALVLPGQRRGGGSKSDTPSRTGR